MVLANNMVLAGRGRITFPIRSYSFTPRVPRRGPYTSSSTIKNMKSPIIKIKFPNKVFARIFICWHPAHTTSPIACCTRPTSALGKYLQGLHFFGIPAADPQEFVSAVQWWLGGTLRLGLVPVLWLLIPEIFMRLDLYHSSSSIRLDA